MPVLTATQISQADLKADVEDLLDKLVNGAPEHSLEFAARLAAERSAAHHTHGVFKTWSMNNRMFLEAQAKRRGASLKFLFAGVDQWRKMNREVIESELERNYSIWGSPVYRVREKQAAGAAPNGAAQNAAPANAAGNPGELRFRRPAVLAVYDWTQTRSLDENYEEPSWDVPLGYGDYGTLNTLVESSPVPVTFADLAARNESGWLDRTGITIDERSEIGNQISTLAHELGHYHLGHLDALVNTRDKKVATSDADGQPVYSARAVCEQEAAMVQWLVMKMLGLDESVGNQVTTQAAEYLSSWTKLDKEGNPVALEGKKSRRRLLNERMGAALKVADQIVADFMTTQAARQAA